MTNIVNSKEKLNKNKALKKSVKLIRAINKKIFLCFYKLVL